MRTEWRLYQASEWETGKRAYFPLLDPEADRQIDEWTILKIRSDARKVFVNYGPLKTAIYEKARYAVDDAWIPQFVGQDDQFGKAAKDWLVKIWFQTGNIVGPIRNWWESLKIESRYLDVYGEIFVYKALDKDGYPRFQHIPPHRIDNPRDKSFVVDNKGYLRSGPYSGMRCLFGIIMNDWGCPVAYSVIGNTPEKDIIVPSENMIHVADWEFVDQTRPISAFAHGILNVRDIIAIQANEKRALEIASSISILENNPIGGIDVNDPTQFIRMYPGVVGVGGNSPDGITPPPYPGYQTGGDTVPGQAGQPMTPYMWMDNGQWKHFKAGTGSDVKAFQFERPAGEVKDFLDRLARDAINFVWPFDLVNNPSGGSANNRTLWVRANKLTKDRQNKLYPAAKQRVLFAVANAIELGILPGSEDWMEWDFSMPRKPSIDAGRDAQQDREDIKMGVKSWSDLAADLGGDVETLAFRKALDVLEMLKAKKLAEDMYEEQTGVQIVIPDDYMFMLTPNGAAGQPGAVPAGGDNSDLQKLEPDPEEKKDDELEAENEDEGGDAAIDEETVEESKERELLGAEA